MDRSCNPLANSSTSHTQRGAKKDGITTGNMFQVFDVVRGVQDHPIFKDLHFITCQNWLVFVRKEFDCVLNEEPQQAISFFLHLRSGQFLIRVWARTVKVGFINDVKGVHTKLEDTFHNTYPCTGIVVTNSENSPYSDCMTSDVPILRMYSTSCQHFYKQSSGNKSEKVFLCEPCKVMKNIGDISDNEWDGEEAEKDMSIGENVDNFVPIVKLEAQELDLIELKNEENSFHSVGIKFEASIKDEEMVDDFGDRNATERKRENAKKDLQYCNLCPAKFEKLSLLYRHKKIEHLLGKFPCTSCDNIYKSGKSYFEHIKEDHITTNTLHCTVCNNNVELALWLNHVKDCVKRGKVSLKKDDGKPKGGGKIVIKNGKDVLVFQCRYCPKDFPNISQKVQHQRKEHKGLVGYDCIVCSKNFPAYCSRQVHMQKAHEYGNYNCPVCEEKSKFAPDLLAHLKNFHAETLTAPCDICLSLIHI